MIGSPNGSGVSADKRKSVIVTGAAGLLGRLVAQRFATAGWNVTGIDRVAGLPTDDFDTAIVDLTDHCASLDAISSVDCLVHCAAIPRPTGVDARTVFTTNMALMYNAVAAAEAHHIPRIVYASSFSVLGLPFAPQPVEIAFLPVDETHPVAPQDVYALSKWLGEEMIDAWCRRTKMPAVSLRLPWIQTADSFPREVAPRRKTSQAALDLWAYIDADDAADAFLAASAAPIEGHERLFVAAADTYCDVASTMLVSQHMADTPLRQPLSGHWSMIDCRKAETTLGFRACRSWRDYPAAETGQTAPAGENP